MKYLFLILGFILTLTLEAEQFPHLILHFDINKTLIASDKTENKSMENVINELLSRNYSAYWDETLEKPLTFDTYVRTVLLPGAEHDVKLKEKRQTYLNHFTDYLRARDHPLYPTVFENFTWVLNKLKKAQGNVFPSFYHLILELNQKKIPYTLFLRSFGSEVFEVKNEINSTLKELFKIEGKFRKGILYLNNKEPLSESQEIYHFFCLKEHAAIHDDWPYWMEGKMHPRQGKPFYLDQQDKTVLTIFFDDNIKLDSPEENIIAPIDSKTGKSIPMELLLQSKQLVPVNTLEAILNDDYYIEWIREALKEHENTSFQFLRRGV